jgi:hypothetical protein
MESIWKEVVVAKLLRYYTGICLEGLRETTKTGHDTRSPGRDNALVLETKHV